MGSGTSEASRDASQGEGYERALLDLNGRQGTDYRILERLGGSVNSGAAVIEGSSGKRILKWVGAADSLRAQYNARSVTEAIRAKGYPVPTYEIIEALPPGGYALLTVMPGTLADFRANGPALLRDLIRLHRLQSGGAVLPTTWPRELIEGVARGGDGYCFPEAMRRDSPRTARLLETLQQLATAHADAAAVTGGVVHKDFNPGNMLAIGSNVSGVVDWENTCSGDPAYDIAYLWFCIYDHDDCRPILWRHLTTIASPGAIALYLAHIVLGFVSGALEHGGRGHAQRRLDAAVGALADLRSLGIRVPD